MEGDGYGKDTDFKLMELTSLSALPTPFTSRNSPAILKVFEPCSLPLEIQIDPGGMDANSRSFLEYKVIGLGAIKYGRVDLVQVWIKEHAADEASINGIVDASHGHVRNVKTTLQRKKMTALNYAAFFGRKEIVQLLLQHGADPSRCNIAGKNTVHCAILSDNEDVFIVGMLKQLLGDDTQWNGDGVQHLHAPVNLPTKDRHKFDIDAVTSDGWTALMSAIQGDLPETFNFLIKKGADPTIITTVSGVNRCSLVGAACSSSEILMQLLQILSTEYVASVINQRFGKCRYTALHYAMIYTKVKNVQLLLQREADPNIEDGYGNLPIHYMSEALTAKDFKTVVELLKESLNKPDSSGYTLLHRMVRLKKVEYVKILVNEFKANVRCKDNIGRYPLHYACETHGSLDIVFLLTDRYILVSKDRDGYAPLHLAVKANEHEIVQVLLGSLGGAVDPRTKVGHEYYPVGVNIPDDKGSNILHLAVLAEGREEVFETMIMTFLSQMNSINELVNSGNDDGETPLHLAIKYKMNSRIKTLLEHGADVAVMDNKERSCLEAAFEYEIPVQSILLLTKKFSYQQRLNMAIKYKRYKLIKTYLANGATIGVEEMKNAVLEGDEELALILVRYAPNLSEDAINGAVWLEEDRGASDSNEKGILDTPITVTPQMEGGFEVTAKTTLFRELIKRMPDVAIEALERSIEVRSVGSTKVEVIMNYQHLHHQEIIKGCCGGREIDTELTDPLEIIVDNERTSVLMHPVVRSYVYEKWKTHGLWRYLSYYGVFFLFFSLLALFSVIIPHPQTNTCRNLNNEEYLEDRNNIVDEDGDLLIFCDEKKLKASQVLSYLVLILTVYHLCLEAYSLIHGFTDYFLNLTNYFHLGLYISAIIFVVSARNGCGCPIFWQWYFGIASIGLGTLNLIVLSSNFPLVSIYVLMYLEILFTFLRLLVFGVFLLCTFALILFMMFHDPNAKIYNYSDPGYALFTTLHMTTRDGPDLGTLFNLGQPISDFRTIPFHYLNIIVWILLILFFPLVFNNMLISLAVDDVKKVREKAELKQVALQVHVFTDTKYDLSSGILQYLLRLLFLMCKSTRHQFEVHLMKKYVVQQKIRERRHFWRELWHSVSRWTSRRAFGSTKFLRNIEDDSYEKKRQVEIELLKVGALRTDYHSKENHDVQARKDMTVV